MQASARIRRRLSYPVPFADNDHTHPARSYGSAPGLSIRPVGPQPSPAPACGHRPPGAMGVLPMNFCGAR